MQVSCPQCTTRLQLSAAKLPSHPFSIKCPRCQLSFTVTPPVENDAPPPLMANEPDSDPLGLFGDEDDNLDFPPTEPAVPASTSTSTEPPVAAHEKSAPDLPAKQPPTSQPDWATSPSNLAIGWTNSMPAPTVEDDSNTLVTTQGGNHDLVQALASLLGAGAFAKPTARLEQTRRRNVVACLTNEDDINKIETILRGQEYFVTIASSPEQVTTMLQTSHQLDILLLDPNFHASQQGGATIMRYLNMLNPARRRRVFVVVMSHGYRTLDTQAAFTHGVNLVVNTNELESLPTALAKSIYEFNNLYRAFNEASGANPF